MKKLLVFITGLLLFTGSIRALEPDTEKKFNLEDKVNKFLKETKKNFNEDVYVKVKEKDLNLIKKFKKPKNLPSALEDKFKECKDQLFYCNERIAQEFVGKTFTKPKEWQSENTGELMKAMAMFEIMYLGKLLDAEKSIERHKTQNYKEFYKIPQSRMDKLKINSLISTNKARESMRQALGMSLETPTEEAILNFYALGEMLSMGTTTSVKVDKDILKRKELLEKYSNILSKLKKKIEEKNDEKI